LDRICEVLQTNDINISAWIKAL